MQLDDWVLCRIYKKTTPQLYSSPLQDEPSSMDGGLDLGRQHDDSVSVDDIAATYAPAGRLPRPASISDYLVDYTAVSELFESMPAPETTALLGTDAGSRLYVTDNGQAASSSSAQQQSSHKRRFMEDYSNGDLDMLHASSNKRVMSDQASMAAINNTFSLFEPGQTSLPDRI
uniref:NAC domain-containing protein n=1 Tax=Setaria italica TaxID=4555 RepID=K3XMJ3_SETIT